MIIKLQSNDQLLLEVFNQRTIPNFLQNRSIQLSLLVVYYNARIVTVGEVPHPRGIVHNVLSRMGTSPPVMNRVVNFLIKFLVLEFAHCEIYHAGHGLVSALVPFQAFHLPSVV